MELLFGLHHNNLVRCVGFCHAEDETILVFEYMANDTLNKLLFDHERKVSLTWRVRRNIYLGVASGIHYLHSVAQPKIIHGHLRPSNIFLDQNLNPKVSFQLALLASDNGSGLQSPRDSASTLGYSAPEYGTQGQGSEIFDIYSFGVVLLEIVSGRRSFDPKLPEEQHNLGEWARKLHSEERSNELIDPTLDLEPSELTEAVRIIQIALRFMYRSAEDTPPEMSLVVADISKLGLEYEKELFRLKNDERQVSFGSSTGDFEVESPSSIPKLNEFGEIEEQLAVGTEGAESSDVIFDGQIYKEALVGVTYLRSAVRSKVLNGFYRLIKCASSPGGRLAMLNSKYVLAPPASTYSPGSSIVMEAIPNAIKLAKTQDPQYSLLAVKLMVALTSNVGGEPDSEIILEVADHALDVLISLMRKERLTKTRLLAAEAFTNILVNKQVRYMARGYDGIVPALLAFSNVDAASHNIEHLKRADDVCLKGLKRLANYEMRGSKDQMIVGALAKLLRRGLSYQPELTSLVKDSLLALESLVLAIDHHATSTSEIFVVLWKDISELLLNEGFVSHTTVPGRMAIISIITNLCPLHEEAINQHLFWFLLKMIRGIRSDVANLLEPSSPLEADQQRSRMNLLASSERLLGFCVISKKRTAQSVLCENVEDRRALELSLVNGGFSEIPDKYRLEILSLLDQVDPQAAVFVRGMKFLVNMSKSKDQICRQQVASKLRMLVADKQNLTELDGAGVIAALMTLLQDSDPSCRRDALVALHDLPPSIMIPVDQLPLHIILGFLDEHWTIEERNAAAGLLNLVIEHHGLRPHLFLQSTALKATLNLIEMDLDSRVSQNGTFVLLKLAKEDLTVRHRIAEPSMRGLDVLVKHVRDCVKEPHRDELKKLLTTTLVLFCRGEEGFKEAVIKANGHFFLLAVLRESILKEKAAEGLLELIKNTETRQKVLEAGFVTIAMRSIDARFACTDIALGLDLISATSTGLEHIYSDSQSVSALLSILEHCHEPKGKDAAASVIARLYPRLNCQEDVARQREIARSSCRLFFRCLDLSDMSHCKEFLEALAAIATDMTGTLFIFEERGHQLLMNTLSDFTQPHVIQGLILKILAEMSSHGQNLDRTAIRRIPSGFLDKGIADKLSILFKSNEFNSRTESVKNALILIRNLSLAGSGICEHLVEQGVTVPLLLEVLKRHESPFSDLTELAVKALEKFMDEPSGKQAFIKGNGIQSLVSVLKLPTPRGSDLKSFTTIILTSVAKDPDTRRQACETIFSCDNLDLLLNLNTIMFEGETSRIKWQAAVLMKLLAMYGPTSKVCRAMKVSGSLDALNELRDVQHCKEVRDMAIDVLRFVREKSKECRKEMEKWPLKSK
ncbi:hypothetical protein KC19_12G027400 [Ceratodon purpureus]|uniref:non-specific serine/threonine protein kinase n=1 Tax=Ceratodon purpureus TaxID=3225 RepID=A0A8T0G3H0_CERPU|nr:hypothetical protein KC19_12G027400 [Ceratodon purpureus]